MDLIQYNNPSKEHRILVLSFDRAKLNKAVEDIKVLCSTLGIGVTQVQLPTRKAYFTLLRSPHVHKTSCEQFEQRTHSRLLLLCTHSSSGLRTFHTKLRSALDTAVSLKIVERTAITL